jgi:hypothetical protein
LPFSTIVLPAIVHLPALRGALADDVEHQFHVQAGCQPEVHAFGQALQQPGNADLIDHLGESARHPARRSG